MVIKYELKLAMLAQYTGIMVSGVYRLSRVLADYSVVKVWILALM